MEPQRYEVPSVFGTTYVYTDNPPAGASLVQDYQAQQPVSKPSLEQRIEVLEKAVSNINERLGIKTDSSSVNLDAASELLDSLDSSAATTTPITTVSASASSTTPIPTDPSSASSANSASAPIPSSDDIAKQLGDLT